MAETYTAFGDYLLLKQRSQDGLGTLWRAGEMERTGFKRIVWLRRFDQTGLDRAALESEFAVAAPLAETFKATNVVRAAKFGSEDGVPYAAFDFVPGQPLDQLLERVTSDQFPIAIDNALLIAEKISAALAAALAFEVRGEPLVHGFLVPHLILIGNDGEAMVSSFGLARGFLSNLDRVAVQQLAGPYLAPETLTTYSASRRADVYSLGAILYQLLCGKPLPAEVSDRAAALAAPQLALDEGPVPDDVLAVLRKALADRPEDRYSSAVDFKRDLEKLLYGGAYSPTTFNLALFMDRLYRQEIEEEDRDIQREKTIDVAEYYRPPKGADVATASTPAPSGSRTGLVVALGAVAVLLAVVAYLVFFRPSGQQPEEVANLIQTEVARQLAEREAQLSADLERERQETEKLRQQLAQEQKSGSAVKTSPDEQRRQEDLRKQIAAREADNQRREEELRKVQQQREQAQRDAAAKKAETAQPTEPPVIPTLTVASGAPDAVPTQASQAEAQATAAPVVVQPTAAPTQAPLAAAMPPAGLGTSVREGDMVDFTQVDTAPEVLVDAKPTFGRAAAIAKARGVVILSALVNHRGVVEDVKVLRAFPTGKVGVDEACVEAARKYRFKPATKGGVSVKTWTTLTFQIDLSRGR